MKCYNIWNQSERCEICVYDRAFQDERPIIKIVDYNDNTYVIKAAAIKIGAKKYVVEFIDNVGDRLFYESKFTEHSGDSYTIQVNNNMQGVVKDGLTNLYNRNYIDSRLKSDIKDALKTKEALTVFIADIDFFKSVNDSYGHVVGDELLKKFGELLKENIKGKFDWVGRYGGEEFIAVMPNAENMEAVTIARRIRRIIEGYEFNIRNNKIKITCSIGVYTMKDQELDMQELISRADINLYRAKCEGRNKVI